MFHPDLSTSNILFRVPETVCRWSDDEVYRYLGPPNTGEVVTRGGEPRGIHAPPELVAPIETLNFLYESHLQEAVTIIDYGESYAVASPPTDYCSTSNYVAPEMRFERRIGLEADIWALGCAIFEIRAGSPLFDPFFDCDMSMLTQTVRILGRLPDPWWSSFGEQRSLQPANLIQQAYASEPKSSIRKELRLIGTEDVPSVSDEGPMVEKSGVKLDKEEMELLGDLLRKMLRYRPEERIGMREVVEHPWFEL
jgi:serine/threonine protein kinase